MHVQKGLVAQTTGGGHPAYQVPFHRLDRPQGEFRQGVVHAEKIIRQLGIQGKMVVAVDHAGHQRLARAVDHVYVRVGRRQRFPPQTKDALPGDQKGGRLILQVLLPVV